MKKGSGAQCGEKDEHGQGRVRGRALDAALRHGVWRGESEVFVTRLPPLGSKVIPPLSEDSDIGDVLLPSPQRDAHLDIDLQYGNGHVSITRDYLPGATVVSPDGTAVFSFPKGRGRAGLSNLSGANDLPSVPTGSYFVVPGMFMATQEQVAVIHAARSGANLEASGLPKVVVASGQTTSLALDVAGALAAARAIQMPK
jgi:hypothetical protein